MRNVFDQPALTRPFGPPSPGGRGTCSATTGLTFRVRHECGTKSKIQDVKLNPLEQSIREMSKLQWWQLSLRHSALAKFITGGSWHIGEPTKWMVSGNK